MSVLFGLSAAFLARLRPRDGAFSAADGRSRRTGLRTVAPLSVNMCREQSGNQDKENYNCSATFLIDYLTHIVALRNGREM